ncbi:MAG: hypothetical protein JWO44_371 [Bacteroidetes bacterium]|nr:hypothetical protein [Bacteroidota bacterium]
MNTTAGKYIGINQRVPFKVLDQGILSYLQTDVVNREELKEYLREFTKGENRVSKAANYANAILTKPTTALKTIKQNLNADTYLRLSEKERKALVLSLVALTYPIAYDLLVALATGFKVQSQINKKFISQKMSAIYGSNRTLDIALDALLPMLIELGAIQRAKMSIYELAPHSVLQASILTELFIYTDIRLSGSKSILLQELTTRPWYEYYSVEYKKEIHNKLLTFSEARIGGGYISIS